MKSVSETGRATRFEMLSAVTKSTIGRSAKAASVATLALLLGLTACDNDYTLAYVYAPSASATAGLINAYGIDNQTGKLRLLQDSPIPSGGRKPIAIVATPDDKTKPQALYVINHDDSNIVEFTIGTDGKIYPQNTYNTTATRADGTVVSGSFPVALAISPNGNFLYVAYTYQQPYTPASPGPGGISVFQINSDRSLTVIPPTGTTLATGSVAPQDFPIGRTPSAIIVSRTALASGQYAVYVATQDSAAVNAATTGPSDSTLNLFAFSADPTSGTLSLLPGETIVSGDLPSSGYPTGASPAGLIEDSNGSHLYVSDSVGNQVISYTVAANGVPALIAGGAATTETGPTGMAIDPSGTYLFVANYTAGTIGEYTFGSAGQPIASTVTPSTAAGTGTTCVAVEPTHGIYLYASGSLSNTITGEEISTVGDVAGNLRPIIGSPYVASTLPTCTVAVPRFQ